MRDAFIKWLESCWNDHYEVWSAEDCNQHIVQCGPYSDIDKFITLLNRFYDCHVQDCPWGTVGASEMRENKFLIFIDGKTVEIRPFDDDIYHVDLVQED